MQDTVSDNFTTDKLTLTRSVRTSENANIAVDVNSNCLFYDELSKGSFTPNNQYHIQLIVTKQDGTKETLYPIKRYVTEKHIRYVFENVPNAVGCYYNIKRYNSDLLVKENDGKGILKKQQSVGLLSLSYVDTSSSTKEYKLSPDATLTASVTSNSEDWDSQSFEIDTNDLATNSKKYYYIKVKEEINGKIVSVDPPVLCNFNYGSNVIKTNADNSLDGIIIKLYKDGKGKITAQLFLNNPQPLVRYNLNFALSLKSDKTSTYGKYLETNYKGSSDNDRECFVIDNSEDKVAYDSAITESTSYSDSDIMNCVVSPELYRQKYGYIQINLNKESFTGSKYELQGNSQSNEYAELTMYNADNTYTPISGGNIFNDDNIGISGDEDCSEILRVPLYNTDGIGFNYVVKENSIPKRFVKNSSTIINFSQLNGANSSKSNPYIVTINDLLKKGLLQIKKKAFDNQIKGLSFNISDERNYNEIVMTDKNGIAGPSAKATSDGKSLTTKLPLYDANNILITYIVKELGIENADGTYSIPRKYNPEVKTIEKSLLEDKTVTFDYDNISRDDFSTRIDNINNICYGDTGSNKTLTSYDKGSYKIETVDSNGNTSTTPESTNNNGKIYENQIGSFDVTFTNNINDSIAKTALCEIKIDGNVVFSKTLSFNAMESKTYRILYDYSWNIDVRNVEAYINYDNSENEIIGIDNSDTATLEPLEWIDFSVNIMGIYEDRACTETIAEDENTPRYYYADTGQKVYVKTKFINKNKGRAYAPYITFIYGTSTKYYQPVPEAIPAGNSSGDGYIVTAIPLTVDSVKSVKDIIVRVNWNDRNKEANPNDNEDKVTLETRKDDFSTKIDNINNICYGDTGTGGLCIIEKGRFGIEKVKSDGNISRKPESTNNNGKI